MVQCQSSGRKIGTGNSQNWIWVVYWINVKQDFHYSGSVFKMSEIVFSNSILICCWHSVKFFFEHTNQAFPLF
jgi:hypothetical protein